MPWTPLVLDTFVFDEARLETPEALSDLGGVQSLSQHDFPGGTRKQKSYGYFPAAQKWRGKFHGVDAADRAEGVKRILVAGTEVKLQYDRHSWLGRVARFSPTAHHTWLYEYELEFWPRIDFGSPGPRQPPVTDLGTVLLLHILSLQGLIEFGLNPDLVGQVVAAEIGGPLGVMISQTLDVMASAGGNINNLTAPNRQIVIDSSQKALDVMRPYQNSDNPVLSSPASDAAARTLAIQNIMAASQPTVAVVQAINPNLPVLASQYYGDASKWRTIAKANGIADPQPIGSFSLTIPQQG